MSGAYDNGAYDEWLRYRKLLSAMHLLGLLSDEQYLQIYNECYRVLEKL